MNESETGDATARRLEWGQTRESLRAELLEDGLPDDFVDGLLYEERPPIRRMWPIRAIAGTVASAAGFVVIPLAGLVGGFLLPLLVLLRQRPELRADPGGCGNDGLIVLFFACILGVTGLFVGAILAFFFAQYALVLGLNRTDTD